ncbi:MAG TPA: LacI family DNA-binding transcriptional regulator [Candidatus Dormibacteraeota bacterium]|nr:LacI family DNA-binding transcriptional regulator [Candidatus Dormibacteraeota bacterium]
MPNPRVTLRDVARWAGVHPGTASRALNAERRHLVKVETAERVLAAARELEFRPDPAARSLKTRRSYTVGVLIPDLNNPLFPPIVRGIEDTLTRQGFVALIGNTDNDEERERRVFEGMRSRHVDGFIVATARQRHPLLDRAAAEELPVVLVNRVLADRSLPSASVDDRLGSNLAVAHLAQLGHRLIAHIAGPQDVSTGRGRLQGFKSGMAKEGIPVDPRLVCYARGFTRSEGWRCLSELLESGQAFTAVVAGNDLLALGCYSALDQGGRRCPEDVSVVGFNDMPFIDQLRPPLTSVRIPHYEIGATAAALMLERIANPRGPVDSRLLPPQLVVRGSTATPGSDHRRSG